ncbi:unnamed protein product, partial [Gulo gulo]
QGQPPAALSRELGLHLRCLWGCTEGRGILQNLGEGSGVPQLPTTALPEGKRGSGRLISGPRPHSRDVLLLSHLFSSSRFRFTGDSPGPTPRY